MVANDLGIVPFTNLRKIVRNVSTIPLPKNIEELVQVKNESAAVG